LIRHFNKAEGMSAKHRGGGPVAYGALARSVISAGQLPKPTDDGATFAIARAIGNLSKAPPAEMSADITAGMHRQSRPRPVYVWKWLLTALPGQLLSMTTDPNVSPIP
jgi:hypothetical protein